MRPPTRASVKTSVKTPVKRPELLLASIALFAAAALLLAAGTKTALENRAEAQPEPARQNPFEAAQSAQSAQSAPDVPDVPDVPGGATEGTAVGGSYVVGYTGVAVYPDPGAPQSGQAQAPPQTPQTQPPAVYPVNLNTATQAQLETLPGIGPVKAQAILAWRAANGGFANANQLLLVQGIGQKTVEALLPYITW